MNVATELADLGDLLQALAKSCDDLAAVADSMTPGQFRSALLGIADAMRHYQQFVTVIQTIEEPQP